MMDKNGLTLRKMVVKCPLVITSIGETHLQIRPVQEWGIIGPFCLLRTWHWVMFLLRIAPTKMGKRLRDLMLDCGTRNMAFGSHVTRLKANNTRAINTYKTFFLQKTPSDLVKQKSAYVQFQFIWLLAFFVFSFWTEFWKGRVHFLTSSFWNSFQ